MNEIISKELLDTYSVVTNETGEKQAVALRGKIKQRIAELDESLNPARKQIKDIRLEHKAQVDEIKILKHADKVIEQACKKFKREQYRLAQVKKQSLIESQKEKDKVVQSPIPVTVAESVPNPEKRVHADNASMSYTKEKRCIVMDWTKVPVFYKGEQILLPNMPVINRLVLRQGEKIDGIEIYEDMGTMVRK